MGCFLVHHQGVFDCARSNLDSMDITKIQGRPAYVYRVESTPAFFISLFHGNKFICHAEVVCNYGSIF